MDHAMPAVAAPQPPHPGSTESSPRSAHHGAGAEWDEPLPPVPGAKLRLMCSYGGHIIPRPHDKSLCYVGGETRIIAVERNSSLSDLTSRLSRSLLDGRKFTLKYQLPNEDLDSLISVATDEDLDNMIEEYDRILTNASSSPHNLKPASSRLRLFLFFAKPETAKTMGALLDDAKSETWFVDALNGTNILPRGLSDSAAIDDLLSLDSATTEPGTQLPPSAFPHAAPPAKPPHQDVQSIQSVMPDSPMIETNTSSFDSTTSSPSMAHLPLIWVRVDEAGHATEEMMKGGGGVLLEEHLMSQLRVNNPPLSTPSVLTPTAAVRGGGNESYLNKVVVSDDDRLLDSAVPVASRKPPLPLPTLQTTTTTTTMQQRITGGSGGFNLPSPDSKHHPGGLNLLPSPDSVASDNSIASTTSFSNAALYQDSAQAVSKPNDDLKIDNPTPTPQNNNISPLQAVQDCTTYQHQPQFIQANMHYIPTHTPIPSYYPVYATQQPMHPQIDHHQQYPMYVLPVTQTQSYNMGIQPVEAHPVPPVYATRATATTNNPTGGLVQVAANSTQFQQQYVGYNAAGQPMVGTAANYANYDYSHDHHQQHQQQQQHQMYYTTGQLATATATATAPNPMITSAYQSITPAQAAMIAEASTQLPSIDSNKQPPRTS